MNCTIPSCYNSDPHKHGPDAYDGHERYVPAAESDQLGVSAAEWDRDIAMAQFKVDLLKLADERGLTMTEISVCAAELVHSQAKRVLRREREAAR